MYSYPLWPNQYHSSPGSICFTLSHSPAIDPRTTTSKAPNNTLTPARWKRGSAPPTAGAM